MQITSIACEGYKAFEGPTHLALRPITVLFGKNNSGKTTLARLPLFLTASMASARLYELESHGVSFGDGFRDITPPDAPHPRVSYEISWGSGKTLGATLQHFSSSDGSESVVPLAISIDNETWRSELTDARPGPSTREYPLIARLSGDARRDLEARQEDLAILRRKTMHVKSARPRLESTYTFRAPNDWSLEEVPYILANDDDLMTATSDSLAEALQIGAISVDQAGFAFRLAIREGRELVNLSQAGRGTQSTLPVACLLNAVATARVHMDLLIIEEPEVHLHPSAHGAIADMVIEASARTQVMIETHSENFILRLRRRIAEKRLAPQQVGLFYVDSSHLVTEITLDDTGGAPSWPAGVFESDVEEAQAIVLAKMSAMRNR